MNPNLLLDREKQISPIDQDLKTARNGFNDLQFEEGFQELCSEDRIDITDTESPRYWSTLADYAFNKTADLKEQGQDLKEARLTELLAATPDLVYSQHALAFGRTHMTREQRSNLKDRLSYYNGLVRYAAKSHSGLTTDKLEHTLINVINASVEQDDLKKVGADYVHAVIRGEQPEVIFGQLLEKTDRPFRESSVEEDRKGVDYAVEINGRERGLDVKASRGAIYARGGENGTYVINPEDGQVTIFCLLTEEEMGNHFRIPDKLAEKKGAVLRRILDKLEDNTENVYSTSSR